MLAAVVAGPLLASPLPSLVLEFWEPPRMRAIAITADTVVTARTAVTTKANATRVLSGADMAPASAGIITGATMFAAAASGAAIASKSAIEDQISRQTNRRFAPVFYCQTGTNESYDCPNSVCLPRLRNSCFKMPSSFPPGAGVDPDM
jgi:hypothetical protein